MYWKLKHNSAALSMFLFLNVIFRECIWYQFKLANLLNLNNKNKMQKDERKTDFWINNKTYDSKAAPGRYEVPLINKRKDHYHGPASFGSTEERNMFVKKVTILKFLRILIYYMH